MDKGNEKNSWDKLSLREKAQYFQQAIAQGITDRKEIIDTYNNQFEEQEAPDVQYANGGLLDNIRKVLAPTYKTDTFGEAFSQAKSAGKPYFKWSGNRYNTITEVEQWRANNPEIDTPQFAHDDMVNRIMAEENSRDNKDGGYNKQNKRWYWHKSVEGGAPTIAWGFKKGMDKDVDRLADSQGGYLTEEQADSLLDVKVNRTLDSAKRYYDKKFGEGSWDLLSPKTQSILGDYQYNPGLSKFPSFTKATHDGDLDTMYKEYKRYTNKQELGRNKTIKNDLDRIAGGYYTIFKANNK